MGDQKQDFSLIDVDLTKPSGIPTSAKKEKTVRFFIRKHGDETKSEGLLWIKNEEHTVGNYLRLVLLRDSRVSFAAYRIPNPVLPELHVPLHCRNGTPAITVLKDTLDIISQELSVARANFTVAINLYSK